MFDKTKRPVRLSEEEVQMLGFFVDTHPERADEGIDLIKRLLTDYHASRKAGILAKANGNGK